jgi:ketosteroid isomerase-like protein
MPRVALSMFAAIVLSACATAPSEDIARSSVAALVQQWSDAGEAGDWDAVADTYADAEGFAWIEQGEVRYSDRASIVAGLDMARRMQATVRNDVSDIVVTPLGGGAAAFRANYTIAVASEQFSFSSEGVLSGVAIRQTDRWRFLQGAFAERPQPR